MTRLANNVAFAADRFEQAEKKALAEARVRWLAMHDPLTELPNRAMFGLRLRAEIEHAEASGECVAVLFIDLDRFKSVNDSLGHDCGDALLVQTGRRINKLIGTISQGSGELVARIGGDEFVAILRAVLDREMLEVRAREILAAIGQPLLLGGVEYRPTASIGIAMCPEDGSDEATLLKSADRAMYNVKDAGKNDVRFHVAARQREAFDTLALEQMLRSALDREEFEVYYQPKISANTNLVTGLEALLRWTPPGPGPVPPQHFIPLAEESGLIVPIGRWVLRRAMAQATVWRLQGLPELPIAVNISPRQFLDPKLLNDVDEALLANNLPGRLLQLEITEGVAMRNVDHAIDLLQQVRLRGVGIAIDDFGSGYSSMSVMKSLPVDTIKIDRLFVSDLPGGRRDSAIVTAIIGMARALGLRTVAEGVETEAQAKFLAEAGCDEFQGFLFSRAIPAQQMPAFLSTRLGHLEKSGPIPLSA